MSFFFCNIGHVQSLSRMLNKQNQLLAHYSIFSIVIPKREDPAMCDKVPRKHNLIAGFRNMTHILYDTYH